MGWTPAHEAHAIERVNISIGFAEPVSSKVWPEIAARLTAVLLAHGFASQIIAPPGPGPGQLIAQFVIGPGGVQQSASEGRIFQIHDQGNVREEVHLFRDRILYNSTRYAGWSKFCARFNNLLRREIDEYVKLLRPSLIKLEYWDRFNFDGAPNDVDYSELISRESKFVPAFVHSARDLLHAHVGFFAPAPQGHKRLININADAIDLMQQTDSGEFQPKRSVGVYSFAQDQLDEERGHSMGADAIASTFDELHTILKDVIGDVITGQMADRISLKVAG